MMTEMPPFGGLLRRWREQRRMTQSDLALAADSSTRHLSCLETGKSQPSRELIHRLAELLAVPLRERNQLLLAAGFAPAFKERSLDELEAAKSAMDRILRVHWPYPAFAVDRHWKVVLTNGAIPQLYEGCDPELLRTPVNALRLMLHPHGMASRILNFPAWRAHGLGVLRQQIAGRPDPVLQALYAELSAYPVPASAADASASFDGPERLATPLRIATSRGAVSFLSTVTVFGRASDITLAELALEMLFPADDQTVRIVSAMLADLSGPASRAVAEEDRAHEHRAQEPEEKVKTS
jgi:transcriptional regulator with XRE-family HTH domain